MSLLAHLLGFRGPLNRADRKRWVAAETLNDLGELTAQWLEGRIDSQPNYYGRVDVDEGEAPGLTAALVACNRAGFLTSSSQAGSAGEGYDGRDWTQLAAVTGFAFPARLHAMQSALGRDYKLIAHPLRRGWSRPKPGVVVTRVGTQAYTTFGRQMDRGWVETEYDGCSTAAIKHVCRASQVTVYDPEPGRNTLWRDLRRSTKRRPW